MEFGLCGTESMKINEKINALIPSEIFFTHFQWISVNTKKNLVTFETKMCDFIIAYFHKTYRICFTAVSHIKKIITVFTREFAKKKSTTEEKF